MARGLRTSFFPRAGRRWGVGGCAGSDVDGSGLHRFELYLQLQHPLFLTPGPMASGLFIHSPPRLGRLYPGVIELDRASSAVLSCCPKSQPRPCYHGGVLPTAKFMSTARLCCPRTLPPKVGSRRLQKRIFGAFLRKGSNEISVTAINQTGPPALSLKLKSENFLLKSDESWEVSVSGSNWRAARAASATPRPGKGNELYLLETTGGALRRCWPLLCLFAAISVCGVVLLQHYIGRATSSRSSIDQSKIILVTLGSVWVLLFVHNFPSMPAADGFDATSHLQYVSYVEHNKALPSASEGWEMFQPPLYYIISAIWLGMWHYDPFQSGGMMLLRYLSLTIGCRESRADLYRAAPVLSW